MANIVKLRTKEGVGAATFRASFGGKPHVFDFNKANKFTCVVPTLVRYRDSFGEMKVGHENYAQFLLDNYPDILEIAEVVKEEEVVEASPEVVDPSEKTTNKPRKSAKPKKGTEHEEVSE